MEKKEGERHPLKEWRLSKHWGIRELARQAKVSTDALMRAERGEQVWDVTARKIADALGVRVDQVQEFVLERREA
jgi:transcriptional regulator with XRE-family HTH domain